MEVPIPIDEDIGLVDPASEDWAEPIGIWGQERLEAILIYSSQGHAVRVNVEREYGYPSNRLKVSSVEAFQIPEDVDHILPVDFVEKHFLAFQGETIYYLDFDTLETESTGTQPSNATWHGNHWERWSILNTGGLNLYTWSNSTWFNFRAWIPADPARGVQGSRISQTGAPISQGHTPNLLGTSTMGAPLIMDARGEENGSIIVLATDVAVNAISLKFETTPAGGITAVRHDRAVWSVTYEEIADEWGHEVVPIDDTPISFASDEPHSYGQYDRVFLATNSGHLYSIFRENGTLDWVARPSPPNVTGTSLTGMWPSGHGDLVVTGTHDGVGFIAIVEADTGRVRGNGSWATTLAFPAVGRPQYISSSRQYLINTGTDVLHFVIEPLDHVISFQVPGGTASPASYVGNIVNNIGSSQGNYYAVVRPDGSLFIQTTYGEYILQIPMPAASENPLLAIIGTDWGDITIELFIEECPETVGNFVNLSESDFYDGLTMHRVLPEFLIQGGCPNGDGTGGPGYTIPDEPSAMDLPHSYGAVSMANSGPDTAGSQFFIVVNESGSHHLDGYNAVFGQVVDDISAAVFISQILTWEGEKPFVDVIIHDVTIVYPRNIVPPVAFAGEDVNVTVNVSVELNGSLSTDDEGIATWAWSYTYLGEEIVLYGPVQNVTFDQAGDVEVTLAVTDAGGNAATDEMIVSVQPEQPPDDPNDKPTPSVGLNPAIYVFILIVIVLGILGMVMKKRR